METSTPDIISRYAQFVSRNYMLVFLIVIFITVASSILSSNVETKSISYKNMVPEDMPAIKAMNLVSDAFGGTSSAMFVVQVDSRYNGSDEIRDLRDYRAMEYYDALASVIVQSEDVIDVSSPASSIKSMNGGSIPKSNARIREIINSNPAAFERSISRDYEVAIVSIQVNDDANADDLVGEMELAMLEVPVPPGLAVSITGGPIQGAIIQKQIGPDMGKTGGISFILIIALCIMVFGSVVYGLIPISTIAIGVVWLMGFLGLMNLGLNAMTSGAISMIMGIGIDFGIQVTMRFRDEYASRKDAERAMERTILVTFMPMLTTTLAALIGFKAMSLGQLRLLGELGTMMSYGVVSCFLVAVTLVPAILIIWTKHNPIAFLRGE